MGFKLEGIDELKAALERLRDGAGDASDAALESHMTDVVYPETQLMVPKETGLMAATGHVEPTEGAQHSWSIWYGDSAVNDKSPGVVDYAAAVHERDATHMPPTQYKFVEQPLYDSVDALKKTIGDKFEELLE